MPRASIIDKRKLPRLIKIGKTQKQIAEIFGVSEAAVSIAIKNKKIATGKAVTLEVGYKVAEKNLNAVAQLQKINKDANEILDLVMGWARGDKKCIRILETQVKKVKWRDKESGEDRELDVQDIKFKDPRELAIKAMSEIRGQLSLQLEIFQTLYDIEAVAEFQREVLDAIAEVAPAVQKTIISNLKKRKALRESVSFRKLRSDL